MYDLISTKALSGNWAIHFRGWNQEPSQLHLAGFRPVSSTQEPGFFAKIRSKISLIIFYSCHQANSCELSGVMHTPHT